MKALSKFLKQHTLEVKTYGVSKPDVFRYFEEKIGQYPDYIFCDLVVQIIGGAMRVFCQVYYSPSTEDSLVIFGTTDELAKVQEKAPSE